MVCQNDQTEVPGNAQKYLVTLKDNTDNDELLLGIIEASREDLVKAIVEKAKAAKIDITGRHAVCYLHKESDQPGRWAFFTEMDIVGELYLMCKVEADTEEAAREQVKNAMGLWAGMMECYKIDAGNPLEIVANEIKARMQIIVRPCHHCQERSGLLFQNSNGHYVECMNCHWVTSPCATETEAFEKWNAGQIYED